MRRGIALALVISWSMTVGAAGAVPADPTAGRADPILSQVDKARTQYNAAIQAAEATALKSFDRQLNASTAKGDLDEAKLIERARDDFKTSGRFDAHDLPLLVKARQQWLKSRERAARDVLAAFDRGIKAYTKARRLDEATALRRERDDFARTSGAGVGAAGLPAGAVLYLSFEPETITRKAEQAWATDQSGAGNDGLFRGAKVVKDGARGSGVRFDGAASIDCGKGPKLEFRGGITVAAFVRVDGPTHGPLVTKDHWDPAHGFTLRLFDSRPDFTIADGRWHPVFVDQPLTPGRWHHLAGTYDGEELRLYVDGKAMVVAKLKIKILNSPFPLLLGQDPWDKGRLFTGSLDEVMVFDRVLGEQEVKSIATNR